MASKVIRNATLKWCKFGVVDQYGKYGCAAYLDKEGIAKMKAIGLSHKLKKDKEEGSTFFRAVLEGEKGPVIVKDKDGNEVTSSISNGATANLKLDVYEYKRYGGGTTCRLIAVQLLDWEPYDSGEDFDDSGDDGDISDERDPF